MVVLAAFDQSQHLYVFYRDWSVVRNRASVDEHGRLMGVQPHFVKELRVGRLMGKVELVCLLPDDLGRDVHV